MKKALALLIVLVSAVYAEVGEPAQNFTLKSAAGKEVSLSDFKGKVVVLEWTNPGCPFVKKHYGSGNMQKLQKDATAKGVVWLSICSSAPGKQGNMSAGDAAKASAENGSAATAYLLDEDGKVGQLYGAKRTPEMYVINKDGTLVYHGAIDDKKTPDPADIAGAKNYVAAALDDVLAGKPVSTPQTEAYGCSVKYGE
ncbi:MAG: thioredoxin family protein [Verrucomicrobia bacterium]|nr:thioredoxin family protein [Verrucomicrobiota bacterium]